MRKQKIRGRNNYQQKQSADYKKNKYLGIIDSVYIVGENIEKMSQLLIIFEA